MGHSIIGKKRKGAKKEPILKADGTLPGMNGDADSARSGDGKLAAVMNSSRKVSAQWMSDLRYGRSLSVDFFKKNAWLLLIILVAILSLIGLRYKTKTKMAEIKRLTVELQRAESSKLQEKASYMSLIRETELQRLVQEQGLGLQFQEDPPYELTLDDKDTPDKK